MPRISRDTDIYPISLRELEVVEVGDITPAMRRITFGGPGLLVHLRDGEEVPALISDGFDDDVRLILPDPETGARPYPRSLGDGRLDWNEEVNELFRTYTVRKWTPEAGEYGELVIDFARHGAGLAEEWSAGAAPGDRVFIAGPKNCGSHPSHTDWLLLIGDETALPAIGRCLEEAPEGHPVVAIIEVPTRADIQEIDCAANLDLRWMIREEGGDFTEEARRLGEERGSFPSGTPFVWASGEAGRLKRIRAVVKEAEVPREHVQIIGYWRRNDRSAANNGGGARDVRDVRNTQNAQNAQSATDGQGRNSGQNGHSAQGGQGRDTGTSVKGSTAGGAGSSSISPLMELHEMGEVAPGLALRAAAQLGLFDAVDTVSSRITDEAVDSGDAAGELGAVVDQAGCAVPSVSAVATELGIEGAILLRFLRYLESLRLVSLVLPEVGEGVGSEFDSAMGANTGPAAGSSVKPGVPRGNSAATLDDPNTAPEVATGVRLTALGQELADPEGMVTHLTGPEALRDLAWLHLVDALRTATPVPVGSTGETWAHLREAEPAMVEDLADDEASRTQWVAPALAQSLDQLTAVTGGQWAVPAKIAAAQRIPQSVVVAGAEEGTGAAVYADELLRRHHELQVTVLDTGAGVRRLTAEVGTSRRNRLSIVPWDRVSAPEIPGGPVDMVLLIDPYALVAPKEVTTLLSAVSCVSPVIVVVTQVLAESGDEEHDYEEDITRLLLTGRAVPTARDLSRAVSSAGLTGVADLTVGWGTHAVVTVRR